MYEEAHGAGSGALVADQHLHDSRLAGAVRPEEAEQLVGTQAEAQVPERHLHHLIAFHTGTAAVPRVLLPRTMNHC